MLPSPDGDAGEVQAQSFLVDASDVGARLDAFLAGVMPPHISRSRVKVLIQSGEVMVGDRPCPTPNYRLKEGDTIRIVVPDPVEARPEPEPIPLDVLYEDEHLIVVDKPAGMVVHPAPGNPGGTLVNALLHHCGDSLKGIGGVKRPGIVHRLDKDTSGVMVAAKTEKAQAGLAAQFADHGRSGPLERRYLALVWGQLPRQSGTIDAPLGRSGSNRLKRAVVSSSAPDARNAVTHYRVRRRFADKEGQEASISLVECRLETGRTHQIRVHMAHTGHPLIGDRDYGQHFATKTAKLPDSQRQAVESFPRQALHAEMLSFAHPVTDEVMRFSSPLPDDFARLVQAIEIED